jgi:hypothetical protein
VLLVLVVVNLVRGDDGSGDDGGAVADVSGTTSAPRAEDLPVLPVEVPPPPPEADANCPQLMRALPLDLLGEPARLVDSDTPYAAAWGDPPVVLVCGVPQPEGLVPGEGLFTINGVTWFVDQSDPSATVWTAVDRAVYVEVSLPPDVDSAPVTALSDVLAATLPAR